MGPDYYMDAVAHKCLRLDRRCPVCSSAPPWNGAELFPIREVARLTGVNPVTLRARWERRGLIAPTALKAGIALYSMSRSIERIQHLNWIERGGGQQRSARSWPSAAPLQVLAHIIPSDLVQADYAQWQQQLADAVSAFDDIRLEQVYGQIFSSYSQPVVFQDIILPLWRQLLQRQDTFGRVSEWLFLDGFLRSRVVSAPAVDP